MRLKTAFSVCRSRLVEGDEVKQRAAAAAHGPAIAFFDAGAVEVGGEVGEHAVGGEIVVAGQQQLGHHVDRVAEMLHRELAAVG